MERWNTIKRKKVVSEDIDAFITDIVDVYKKHNMSISHEDNHGAFEIKRYSQNNVNWLNNAHDCIEIKIKKEEQNASKSKREKK